MPLVTDITGYEVLQGSVCHSCHASRLIEWDAKTIDVELYDPKHKVQRSVGRDFISLTSTGFEGPREKYVKIHCLFQGRSVEFPLSLCFCPFFATPEEIEAQKAEKRRTQKY